MVLVEDKKYHETLDILRGKKQLSPLYTELKDWLKSEFGITAYNFEFKKIEHNNPNHQYELYILLSSENDYNSMQVGYRYDPQKQDIIADKLYELAQKYKQSPLSIYKDVHVCYNNFSVEMQTDFNSRASNIIRKVLMKRYADHSVWEISPAFYSTVVFYYRDTDIKLNRESGISKKIKDEYYEVLHQIDEFNLFEYDSFLLEFDSKENVDNHYDGNLYYYFK